MDCRREARSLRRETDGAGPGVAVSRRGIRGPFQLERQSGAILRERSGQLVAREPSVVAQPDLRKRRAGARSPSTFTTSIGTSVALWSTLTTVPVHPAPLRLILTNKRSRVAPTTSTPCHAPSNEGAAACDGRSRRIAGRGRSCEGEHRRQREHEHESSEDLRSLHGVPPAGAYSTGRGQGPSVEASDCRLGPA